MKPKVSESAAPQGWTQRGLVKPLFSSEIRARIEQQTSAVGDEDNWTRKQARGGENICGHICSVLTWSHAGYGAAPASHHERRFTSRNRRKHGEDTTAPCFASHKWDSLSFQESSGPTKRSSSKLLTERLSVDRCLLLSVCVWGVWAAALRWQCACKWFQSLFMHLSQPRVCVCVCDQVCVFASPVLCLDPRRAKKGQRKECTGDEPLSLSQSTGRCDRMDPRETADPGSAGFLSAVHSCQLASLV